MPANRSGYLLIRRHKPREVSNRVPQTAREAIVTLSHAPLDFWLLQTAQRTGPQGKASFLRQIQCNYFVDDNALICREARRTSCVVTRADAGAGEQGLIDDLDSIQQNIEARDRSRIPVARQLTPHEFLFDPRAPPDRGQGGWAI